MTAALDAANRGFRDRFLDYEELTEQLDAWAEAFPELVRKTAIGTSTEGRQLWLLTIGRDPDRARPAVWVDGNMHASELCGSSVALAIAEDAIRAHLGGQISGLSAAVQDRIREVLFYVLPRMSPDGAECVLKTGRYVRSSTRDERRNRGHARWLPGDIDGDGQALVMRVVDATGEFVESSEWPGLMVPRSIDDAGPFYKIYPEGIIENYDGETIPSPSFLSDNQTDLNRNFPWSWAPSHEQDGAGPFPLSEPESRAVVEFTAARPHIFAWLNLHTFGGVFIRPLGHQPDSKMHPSDLALFRQIGAWAAEETGYPMVSGFEEFTYEPDKPLHGDLTDYGFHQCGAIAYVVELWDLFSQVGLPARGKRFVDRYSHLEPADLVAIARWDAEHNQRRVVRGWRAAEHPQLGAVEVGGIDPRVGLWNPPYEALAEVCASQSRAFLRVAGLAPHLQVSARVERVDGLARVLVTVENQGYLPTFVLESAKKLESCEPLYLDVKARGCELLAGDDARRQLGHLDGWGRGKYDGSSALYFTRSRGSTGRAHARFTVRGTGTVELRVGCCRTGFIEHSVTI